MTDLEWTIYDFGRKSKWCAFPELRKEKQAFCDIKQKYCVVLSLVKEKLEHLRSYQGSYDIIQSEYKIF